MIHGVVKIPNPPSTGTVAPIVVDGLGSSSSRMKGLGQ